MKLTLFLIFTVFSFASMTIAQSNTNRSKYWDNYKQITEHFLYTDNFSVNMRLNRELNKSTEEENMKETIEYYETNDHYLEILQVIKQNQVPVKEKHFFYSPDGDLLMAVNEIDHFERTIFMYDFDNPVIYLKSSWNPNQGLYKEVEFGTMRKDEDGEAQQLLKQSVGLYNSTIEFLDNISQ